MRAFDSRFRTRVPGKWVLAGEHSVLKGATALAMPHPEFFFELEFVPERDGGLKIEPAEARGVVSDILQALEDTWSAEGKSFPKPEGMLRLASSIPVGAGLGSSAALCVAITQWISEPLGIAPGEVFEFARGLENRFHGKSSGMDVAAALSGEPIAFTMAGGAKVLGVKKLPRFTFHDTGLRERTSACVMQVDQFREQNPFQAVATDERMGAAARMAMDGLSRYHRGESEAGVELVARAMREAHECFLIWRLVPAQAQRLIEEQISLGARAAKLTGAGGGGFVVALWD